MTRDEQRMVWRTYAAAALQACGRIGLSPDEIVNGDDIRYIGLVATALTAEELRRYNNTRDHIGDATTKVEPRPWVDLTEAEITQIVAGYYATYEDLVRLTQDRLREKNGGTR